MLGKEEKMESFLGGESNFKGGLNVIGVLRVDGSAEGPVARLYHPKGVKGCGHFHTKISLAKKILQSLRLPVACKLYVLADSWYWGKELALLCGSFGYQMISQLKPNSVVWQKGEHTPVAELASLTAAFREVPVFLYGKNKR